MRARVWVSRIDGGVVTRNPARMAEQRPSTSVVDTGWWDRPAKMLLAGLYTPSGRKVPKR